MLPPDVRLETTETPGGSSSDEAHRFHGCDGLPKPNNRNRSGRLTGPRPICTQSLLVRSLLRASNSHRTP